LQRAAWNKCGEVRRLELWDILENMMPTSGLWVQAWHCIIPGVLLTGAVLGMLSAFCSTYRWPQSANSPLTSSFIYWTSTRSHALNGHQDTMVGKIDNGLLPSSHIINTSLSTTQHHHNHYIIITSLKSSSSS
jgi:hypothetical protein